MQKSENTSHTSKRDVLKIACFGPTRGEVTQNYSFDDDRKQRNRDIFGMFVYAIFVFV